tara:strand:- start:2890 stop:3180 length:291 start_codon:yes stop_codon:yes gene_type:complete
MFSFKQFFEDHEDPNGELQAGMAASGANTVTDGDVRQRFMGSEKKITIKIKAKEPWKVARGHTTRRGGAGVHGDRRLGRLKTRSNKNRSAIDDSAG